MPNLNLDTPIRYIKGVGPKLAQKLNKLTIENVQDLLEHYPFRYEDYSLKTTIAQAPLNTPLTLTGKVIQIKNIKTKNRKTMQKAIFQDETEKISLTWFNQPYLIKNIPLNKEFSISGKIEYKYNQKQIVNAQYGKLSAGKIVPVYETTFGLSVNYLKKIVAQTLNKTDDKISENLPRNILKNNNLISKRQAIKNIHFPKNKILLNKAKKRLAFEEMLITQLYYLQVKQNRQKKHPGPKIKTKIAKIKEFIKTLSFELTKSQKQASKKILEDLEKPYAMNRLLQGDVGSGKTIVAAIAVFNTIQNNYQAVFMVPTQILAEQHYQTFQKLFKPFDIKTGLLTGSSKPQTLNSKHLIIGTHALIHKHANFKKIGLVIIDEQHRFGVSQRAKLVKKANIKDQDNLSPHVLTMTATPIPRTISLTADGDLDVSSLKKLPREKKTIKTALIPKYKREDCYNWVKQEIKDKNLQAFIICPLIEKSDAEGFESLKAVTEEYEKLKTKIFPDLKLALLHGKLKNSKKNKILQQMQSNKINILVTTSVVEVGIDLPKATIMIIENANRFGLAQLHQLRGRIGRRGQQAYCFLFAEKIGHDAEKRLKAMGNSNNGLELARLDLKIRGPGEVYGTQQHGFPVFKIADYSDILLIKQTRKIAQKLLNNDPHLNQYPILKKQITKKFSQTLIAAN